MLLSRYNINPAQSIAYLSEYVVMPLQAMSTMLAVRYVFTALLLAQCLCVHVSDGILLCCQVVQWYNAAQNAARAATSKSI
jgi:hypothetical protein